MTLLAGLLAMLAALLVATELRPAPWLAAAMFWTTVLCALDPRRPLSEALLRRLMVAAFAVPFLPSLALFVVEWVPFWLSPMTIQLSRQPDVVATMLLMAAAGLGAFTVGCAAKAERPAGAAPPEPATDTLAPLPFLAGCLGCVLFMWLAAPAETIFRAAYGSAAQGVGLAQAVNFNGANAVAYGGLVVLFLDLQSTRDVPLRRFKQWCFGVALAVILIFFQLLVGDRDMVTTLLALMALHVTGPVARPGDGPARRVQALMLPLLAIFAAGVALSLVRSLLAPTVGPADADLDWSLYAATGVLYNTWTAPVTTVLGAAALSVEGNLDLLWGQTYLDYLLTLPPGFITDAMGIERPIEVDRGPSWYFIGVSLGGTHVLVVPFMNFGIVGIVWTMALNGWLVARGDQGARGGQVDRLLFAALIVGSLHWFWYGPLPLVRTLMAVALAWIAYRLVVVRAPAPHGSQAAADLLEASPSAPAMITKPSPPPTFGP